MSRELFNMKEVQARFENRRLEPRKQNDDRQLTIDFTDVTLNTQED